MMKPYNQQGGIIIFAYSLVQKLATNTITGFNEVTLQLFCYQVGTLL